MRSQKFLAFSLLDVLFIMLTINIYEQDKFSAQLS